MKSRPNNRYIRLIYIILVALTILQLLGLYRRCIGEPLVDVSAVDYLNRLGLVLFVALFILAPLTLWCVLLYKLEKEGRGVKNFWLWIGGCCCLQIIPILLAVMMDMKDNDIVAMFAGLCLGQGGVWYIIMRKS